MNPTQLKSLQKLIREEVKKSLAAKAPINEAFASPILQKLLAQKTYKGTIASAFQKMSQIAIDKVKDDNIMEMHPKAAYNEMKKFVDTIIVFYVCKQAAVNPYAKDGYGKNIPAGTVLAIASGDNKFYEINYVKYGSDAGKPTMGIGKGDNLGVQKTGSGYGATGLYNVKRVAEVADTAYVINLSAMKSQLGTADKVASRVLAKQGAIAFKTPQQFKKENLARYKEALAGRAAKGDVDTAVLEAIQQVTKQITAAVAGKSLSQYGDVLIGKNPKGRDVTASDASNVLNRLLQDFARYSAAKIELEKAGEGVRTNYSEAKVREYALDIKNHCIKINKLDYGW